MANNGNARNNSNAPANTKGSITKYGLKNPVVGKAGGRKGANQGASPSSGATPKPARWGSR